MTYKLGSLLYEVSANVAGIRKDFDQIHKNINSFARKIKQIFRTIGISIATAFSLRALNRWFFAGMKHIESIRDVAVSLGWATDEYSKFAFAAEASNVSIQQLSLGMRVFAQKVYEANRGQKEAVDVFKTLNTTIIDVNGNLKPTLDILMDISKHMEKTGDSAKTVGAAMKLLGSRSGAGSAFMQMLRQGPEYMKNLMNKAEKLGLVISQELGERVKAASINFRIFKGILEGIRTRIFTGMAESLQKTAEALMEFANTSNLWIKVGENLGKALEFVAKKAMQAALAFDVTKIAVASFWDIVKNARSMDQLTDIMSKYNSMIDEAEYKYYKFLKTMQTPPSFKLPSFGGTEPGGMAGDKGQKAYESLLIANKFLNIWTEESNQLSKDGLQIAESRLRVLREELSIHQNRLKQLGPAFFLAEDELKIYQQISQRAAEVTSQITQQKDIVKGYSSLWHGVRNSLSAYVDSTKNLSKQIEDIMTNSLKNMEDALVEFVKTGKASFKDLVNSIASDLLRLGIRKYITGPIAGMLFPDIPIGHQGGIAGFGKLSYAGVPKLHNGLKYDEIPAILQKGEEVIPKKEAGTRGLTINVPVNIAERNPAMSSDLRNEIERTVLNVIRKYS